MTTGGILESLTYCERYEQDEWVEFDDYVALYIDTEGQPAGSGGYVVQLIDDDDNIVAAETQESYISD